MIKGALRSSLLLMVSLLVLFGLLAVGCGGGGGVSSVTSPVPVNMVAVAGNSAVQLSWDSGGASANRTGYRIYRGDESVGPWALIQEVGEVNTWTDHGVVNGEDYWYRLSSVATVDGQVHESAMTAAFPSGGVVPSATLPMTPLNLVAIPGNRQVVLQWDPLSDPTVVGFKVYRGLTPDGLSYHATVYDGSATSFLDDQLVNGVTYWYYIVSFDSSQEDSLPSNTVSATPVDNEAPLPPSNFRGAPGNTRNMLMWDPSPSSDVVSYTVYEGTFTTVLASVPAGATNYVHYPVVNDETYIYWLDAVDADGNHSTVVGPVTLVPNDSVAPWPPANVAAEDGGTFVKLTWEEPPAQVTDIEGFRIARSQSPDGPFEDNENIPDPVIADLVDGFVYVDDEVEVFENYWYLVRTVDKQGMLSALDASAAVGVSVGPPLPPNNVTGSAGDESVTIDWVNNTANADALDLAGFEVWRSNNDDNFAFVASVGSGAVRYTDRGVVNYETYDYYLKAVDSWGHVSQQSNVVQDMRPTDSGGPNPPQNFNASDTLKSGGPGSELRVNLSWTAPEGEYDVQYYEILFSDDNVGEPGSWLVIGRTDGAETYFVDFRPPAFEGLSVWYAVRAIDLADRVSQVSNVDVVVPGAPLAPELDELGIDCDALLLTWSMASNAGLTDLAGFSVLRAEVPELDYHSVNEGVARNARSYIDSSVQNGVEYSYYLECYDEVGNVSGPSEARTGIPNCSDVPLPPTQLQAIDTLDGVVNVQLIWTPSQDDDIHGYHIYRRQNGREAQLLADVGRFSSEYLDDDTTGVGLDENETYYYIVKSYRDVVEDDLPGSPTIRYESENTLWAWATPGRPDAPANLTALGGDHSVSLSWAPTDVEPFNRSDDAFGDPTSERNKDLKQYEVWRSDDGSDYYFLAATGDVSYIDATVNNEVEYFYWLRSRDLSGHVSPELGPDLEINPFLKPPELVGDNYASVIPTDGIPLPVGGLSCVEVLTAREAGAEDGAVLSWWPSDDEDLAGYNIYRGETADGPWIPVALLWGPSTYTDTDFGPNPNDIYRRWWWYVAAVDDNGNESLPPTPGDPQSSTVVSCTPGEPDAPLTFTGFAGNGLISLSWDPDAVTADDVAGFKLYRYEGIPWTPPDPDPNDPQDPDNYVYLTTLNDAHASSWVDDDGVINNTPYWYALTSIDAVGNETLEADWTLTSMIVPNDSVPNPPTGLTAVEVYNPSPPSGPARIEVHLSWNPNGEDDIDHYNVHVRDSGDPLSGTPPYNLLVANAGFATVYIDVPASDGDYTYVVTAVDEEVPVPNESGPSNDARVLVGIPEPPTGLSATGYDSQVVLNWDYDFTDGWDTVGFNVYRRELFEGGGSGPEGLIAELGITDSYTDGNVLNEHRYRWRVTAVDGAGNESAALAGNTEEGGPSDGAPDNPSGVEVIADVESGGNHYFRVVWDQNNEVDLEGYRVYRRIVSGGWSQIADVGSAFTSYDDTGASNNVFYEYAVTAYDIQWFSPVDGNESDLSPASNAVERYQPLAPVWDSPPGSPGDTVITLSWLPNQEPDLDSYRLFRSTNDVDYFFIDDVPGDQESYLDHDLDNGTEYWYGITAVDIFGNESPMSTTPAPIIPQDGPPVAPDNVEIYDDDGSSFFVDWDNNFEPDVIGYNVYRNGVGPEELRYADGEGSQLEDDGSLAFGAISPDTAYVYTVHAVDTDSFGADREGPGTDSNGAEIGAPGIPGGLSSVNEGDEYVEFQWTAVSGAVYPDLAGYKVYRDDNPPGAFAFIADVGNVTNYTDYSLVNEHDYRYAVSSYDIFGNESGLSLPITLTPTDGDPTPPHNVEITLDDGTQFRVEWDPSESGDTADYAIRRVTNGTPSGTQTTMGSVVYLYNDVFPGVWGNPLAGDDIAYQVAAIDEGGNQGEWSHIDNSTCAEVGAPAAPTGLGQLSGDEVVQLSWTLNTECDVDGYSVYRDGFFLASVDASVDTYNDTDVVNGQDYTYTLRAFDVFGNESPDSASVIGSPNDGPPLPVDNCAVTADDASGIRIEWDANPEHDIDHYEVTRQPGGTSIGSTSNYFIVDTTAVNNTAYTYEVVAVDEDGLSSPEVCETLGVERLDPGFINFPPSKTDGDGYSEVSWTGPSLATYPDLAGYNVYLSDNPPDSFLDYVEYNPAGNTYFVGNLTNEQSYWFTILPVDKFGNELSAGWTAINLTPTNGPPATPDYCEIYADDGDGVSLQWVAPNNDTQLEQYVIRRWHWDEDTSAWVQDDVVAGGDEYQTGSTDSTFLDDGTIFEGVPGSSTAAFVDEWNYRYQIAADDGAPGVTTDDLNYCWTANCVERGAPHVLVSLDYDWGGTLPGGYELDNRVYWAEPGIDPDDSGDVAYIHWIYDVDFGAPVVPNPWSPHTDDDGDAGGVENEYSVPCDCAGWKVFITLHDPDYADRTWQLLEDIPNCEIRQTIDHAVLTGGRYCYAVAMYDEFGNVVLPVDGPQILGGTVGYCIDIEDNAPAEVSDIFINIHEGPNNDIIDENGDDNASDPTTDDDMNFVYDNTDPRNTNGDFRPVPALNPFSPACLLTWDRNPEADVTSYEVWYVDADSLAWSLDGVWDAAGAEVLAGTVPQPAAGVEPYFEVTTAIVGPPPIADGVNWLFNVRAVDEFPGEPGNPGPQYGPFGSPENWEPGAPGPTYNITGDGLVTGGGAVTVEEVLVGGGLPEDKDPYSYVPRVDIEIEEPDTGAGEFWPIDMGLSGIGLLGAFGADADGDGDPAEEGLVPPPPGEISGDLSPKDTAPTDILTPVGSYNIWRGQQFSWQDADHDPLTFGPFDPDEIDWEVPAGDGLMNELDLIWYFVVNRFGAAGTEGVGNNMVNFDSNNPVNPNHNDSSQLGGSHAGWTLIATIPVDAAGWSAGALGTGRTYTYQDTGGQYLYPTTTANPTGRLQIPSTYTWSVQWLDRFGNSGSTSEIAHDNLTALTPGPPDNLERHFAYLHENFEWTDQARLNGDQKTDYAYLSTVPFRNFSDDTGNPANYNHLHGTGGGFGGSAEFDVLSATFEALTPFPLDGCDEPLALDLVTSQVGSFDVILRLPVTDDVEGGPAVPGDFGGYGTPYGVGGVPLVPSWTNPGGATQFNILPDGSGIGTGAFGADEFGDIQFHWITVTPLVNAGNHYATPPLSIGDPANYGLLSSYQPPFATSGEPGEFLGVSYGGGAGEPVAGDEAFLEVRFFDSDGFCSISCVYREDEDTFLGNGFDVL